MLFNSLTFLIFFFLFMCGWRIAARHTVLRLYYIVIASSIFYGWWDWRFLFLIFYTGSVDFWLMRLIGRFPVNGRMRKLLLGISVVNALGVLSIFKYSVFFAGILDGCFRWAGLPFRLEPVLPEFCLILPVGISFFTFQSMSYTIDVYRGEILPVRSFVHYMAYLMLFPQLVAGPIVRAKDFLMKLLEPPVTTPSIRYAALKLILLGFFKKCLLADNIAGFVDRGFANAIRMENGWYWWLIMALFAIQIYCDFSGYSDIARGIIKLMGYRFALNFNHPCIACSFKDFWARWHISLSSWFRDYVYLSLGGSRRGSETSKWLGIRNVAITFLLSGLWHGAAWNFVIWGGLHAVYLIIERLTGYTRFLAERKYLKYIGIVIVQIQILVAWVFFRAPTFPEALHIIRCMFSGAARWCQELPPYLYVYIAIFAAMEAFLLLNGDHWCHRLLKSRYRFISPLLLSVLTFIIIFFRGDEHGFIYFQF